MSLAEVVRRGGLARVPPQLVVEEAGVEDVDAHAGQRPVGPVRHAGRVVRLLDEVLDAVLAVDPHHPEGHRLLARHLDAAHRHVGPGPDVLLEHRPVVHLVDVVAGQHDDVLDRVALDDLEVLEHRVGGALVPLVLGHLLAGREDVEALVALGAQEGPAALEVADQAVGLVLRRHADAADAGVERVGEREVDDPGGAAEVHRRLGAAVGQLPQPRAAAAGQHERQRVAREAAGPEMDTVPVRGERVSHGVPPTRQRRPAARRRPARLLREERS